MQIKSELLNQILTDYLAADSHDAEKVAAVTDFCNFVDAWFLEHKPVGVSPATDSGSGVTVRFSDGANLSLFPAEHDAVPHGGIAVSITGNSGGSVRGAGGMVDNSVPIINSRRTN
jgi:hypothetical protein